MFSRFSTWLALSCAAACLGPSPASASWQGDVQGFLEECESEGKHRAIALAIDGKGGWAGGAACLVDTEQRAAEMALEQCRQRRGPRIHADCEIYSVNGVARYDLSARLFGNDRISVHLVPAVRKDNPVGQQLLLELEKAIRGEHKLRPRSSPPFRLVEDEKAWPYLRVEVSSVRSGSGAAVSYGVAYDNGELRRHGIFLMSAIHVCPGDDVHECVAIAVDLIDMALETLEETNSDLARTLR